MHPSATLSLVGPALLTVGVLVAALPGGAVAQAPGQTPGEARASGADVGAEPDLRMLLTEGRFLADRSGDGVVDRIEALVVVSTDPSEAETVAAADVAARLGYETSATRFGRVVRADALADDDTAPLILIGNAVGTWTGEGELQTPGAAEATRGAARSAAAAPGEGALTLLRRSAEPGWWGVSVRGYDATGLLAASAYLSGRYPGVWDPEGTTWSEVAAAVGAFVDARVGAGSGGAGGATEPTTRVGPDSGSPAPVTGTVLDRIVVDADRPGVSRARATVTVDDAAAFDRVVRALRGEEPDSAAEDRPEDPAGEVPDSVVDDAPPSLSTLHIRDLHRLDVRVVGPEGEETVAVRPDDPWETPAGRARGQGPDPSFGLPEIYEVGGFYDDTNRDLVPDETVGYLSVAGSEAPEAVGDLATRIGLETAGARFPIARVAGEDEFPERQGFPILVGSGHSTLGRLLDADRLPGWGPAPGEGSVRFVEGALGGRNGLVVAGADAAGTEAAVDWLARRAPYLWHHGKGRYRLADAQTAARRFFQTREAPGQAALALHKLETWMERRAASGSMGGTSAGARVGSDAGAPGGPEASPAPNAASVAPPSRTAPPFRVEVELAVEEAPVGLDDVAREVVRGRFPDAEVDVATFSTGFGVGDTIYARTFDLPWEVETVRDRLEERVYPSVQAGEPATVHVRVSEPPEIRASLAAEIRAALEERGASPVDVTVLNAYKQGYSWLHDDVLPRLRGEPVAAIRIEYHTLEESEEIRWQTIAAETRWLQEIYPVDAVLARELGIPDSAITFHATRRPDPIYRVTALDAAGDTLLTDDFQPRYVVRPFFDLFPEYEQVRVTTGWLTASATGDTLLDERVVTDPEAFWDLLQTDSYGAIVDYVMDIQDGSPSGSNAPFFDEFTVRLRMSEPDHRIGIDEEVISSLEALHEDIYFETLTLFDLIGNRYGVGGLDYPGRVLPYIDPTGTGEPGRATITLTGKERGVPELVVRAFEGEGAAVDDGAAAGTGDREVELRRYGLGPLPVDAPTLIGITVGPDVPFGDGPPPVRRLLFEVEARDSVDRWNEYRERSSEAGIDRSFLSVELLQGMLDQLRRLHGAGLYEEALSWDRVGATDVLLRVEDDSTFHRLETVERTGAPTRTTNPTIFATGWEPDGSDLVQWQTPIPPAENDSILAKLNTLPGVDVYFMTRSFLGQPVWAADFLPPDAGLERGIVSQAKLNALKPTLFISGRQHANEVSSTSHILRLAELLATDSTYRAYLDDVNVVLHPITNPDGARLAVEMQQTNPDFMLHAGYLGALGVDATSGERSDDPIYPESQVRRRIRETWLPDAYVNMHGYPSHEWVQYFAGYSAWVRSRRGGQRDWWAPRGWFIPGFGWTDDEENPAYREAQFAMLDSVTASIRALPDVDAMNERMYARYRKYGSQDKDDFREYFHNGVLAYVSLRGSESVGTGTYSDRITYFSTTTEAPDETARGDWLELVASAGLAHSTALLRYLAEGEYEIEREAEAFEDVVTRRVWRVKPVLPPVEETEDGGGGGDAG